MGTETWNTAPPRQANGNGFVETFNGKLRDECLNENVFESLAEARRILEEWRQDYSNKRPHSALGWRSPEACGAEHQPFYQTEITNVSLAS